MKGITFRYLILIPLLITAANVCAQEDFDVFERIESFEAQYEILPDNALKVTETIKYNSGGLEKHGIFRDIRDTSATGREMEIENISVTDETGQPYPFRESSYSDGVELKIGDPDVTFSGLKTYVISYKATDALSHLDAIDELYWNVTGNNWPFLIEQAKATVIAPEGFPFTQNVCYVGYSGATEACSADNASTSVSFESRGLSAGEGFTIAAGFSKGFLAEYPPPSLWERIWHSLLYWFNLLQYYVAGAMVLGTAFWCFKEWHKYGRDPKGKGVIVPQYGVPDNLTPIEASMIYYGSMPSIAITAEILHLAKEGYLTIEQKNKKILGIFSDTDFYLRKTHKSTDKLKAFDSELMKGLFGGSDYIAVDSLKSKFYTHEKGITKRAQTAVKDAGYYTHFGPSNDISALNSKPFYKILLKVLITLMFFSFIIVSTPIILALISAAVIFAIFVAVYPQRSEKGVATKEWLMGLKQYIEVAEKDRIEFHNAPSKTLEHFETLLPFALLLGVSDIWLKEFAGIYEQSTLVTGSGGDMRGFLTSFNSAVITSTAAPSSSGSGGGGFSGGGGGGGGGGSW